MKRTLLSDLITLWVVVDPVGVVPMFIVITTGMQPARVRAMATRATLIAIGVLLGAALTGQFVLEALGVSITSFQIAGGIVLFLIALGMVLGKDPAGHDTKQTGRDPAIFPLAVPFLAGPGTMLAMIVLTDRNRFSVQEQVQTSVAMILVLIFTWGLLAMSSLVHRWLGQGMIEIASRVMGLILAAFAVQTVIEGIKAAWG